MTWVNDHTSPALGAMRDGTDGRTTVLILPVGAVEPHGPHAPLGTDTFISVGMCERAVAQLADDPAVRALVLPPIPYGVTKYSRAFPGSFGISKATLSALVLDLAKSMVEQGFRRIVLVNNHFEPEHMAALLDATEDAYEVGAIMEFLNLTSRRNAERLTEEFRSGSCHAGRYETSLVLADRPSLVDTSTMAELPEVPVDLTKAMYRASDFGGMGMHDAYCGAPAESTAAEGRDTFATLTAMLVDLVREVAAR